MSEASNKKKGVVILFIVFGVVIVALLAVVIVLLLNRSSQPEVSQETERRNVIVTEDNLESVLEEYEQEADRGQRAYNYTVTMRDTTWTFEDGESASPDSWVKNVANNDTDVYFDITRNDTGETVYSSPIIPLGQELQAVTLDTDLDPGTYDCTLRYSLVDDDQVTVLSTVDIALTIIVNN